MYATRQVGFIPSTTKKPVFMSYSKVKEFCTMIAQDDENKERFEEFKKGYHYFDPSFDFVMMELGFVFLNPLLAPEAVLVRRENALYPVENLDFEDGIPSYQSIIENGMRPQIADMVPVSDQELQRKPFSKENLTDSLIDPNGWMLMSTNERNGHGEGSHDVTAASILNQLFIERPEVIEHYLSHDEKTPAWYLVKYFGFIRYREVKGERIFIHSPETTPSQIKLQLKEEFKVDSDQYEYTVPVANDDIENGIGAELYQELYQAKEVKRR